MRKKLKISIIPLFWILLFQPNLLANAENNLIITSPDQNLEGKLNYVLNAGDKKNADLFIQNLSEKENINIKVYGVDGVQTKEGPWAFKTVDQTQTAVGNWLHFKESRFEIPAQNHIAIPFEIDIPSGVSPGIYPGAIAIELLNDSSEKNAVTISSRTVQTLLITVPGEKRLAYQLTDFSFHQNNKNIGFNLKISNNGNVLMIAKGFIEIYDHKKNIIKRIAVEENNILPNEEIEKFYLWDDGGFFGKYIGQYNAKVSLDFFEIDLTKNEKKLIENLQKEIAFTIIPWLALWLPLSIVIFLFIMKLLLIFSRKSLMKNTMVYETMSEDTVISIATKFNMSWKKLVRINNLKKPYTLKPKTKLFVKRHN